MASSDLVSVQCTEETKAVFTAARAVFGSYPEVMAAAAGALLNVIEGEETIESRRARLRDELAGVSKGGSSRSNSHKGSTDARPGSSPVRPVEAAS